MSETEHLAMALYRSRVLAGDPLPGGMSLLVLRDWEYADNIEVALVRAGVKVERHIRSLSMKRQDAIAAEQGLFEGSEAIPLRGAAVGGLLLDVVPGDFPWGALGVLYLAEPVKRGRGRPKQAQSTEARQRELDMLYEQWKAASYSLDMLGLMKRQQLLAMASRVGIHDPGHKGDNAKLRRRIARKLKLS